MNHLQLSPAQSRVHCDTGSQSSKTGWRWGLRRYSVLGSMQARSKCWSIKTEKHQLTTQDHPSDHHPSKYQRSESSENTSTSYRNVTGEVTAATERQSTAHWESFQFEGSLFSQSNENINLSHARGWGASQLTQRESHVSWGKVPSSNTSQGTSELQLSSCTASWSNTCRQHYAKSRTATL